MPVSRFRIDPRAATFVAGLLLGVLGTASAATMLGSDIFPDVNEGSYFDSAIGEMYDIGVIRGNPDGTFKPGDFVTRADIAVMFKRLRDELTGNVQTSSARSTRSTASSAQSSSVQATNPKGTLRFTTAEIKVPENVSTKKVTIAVVRTGGNEGTVTVEYSLAGGSATADTDYTNTSGTLTFASGDTSKMFDVQIKDDSSGEGNENVTVTLSNPGNGASLGTPASLNLVITDNETSSGGSSQASSASSGPTVGFSAAQYSVNENAGSLTVTVVRSGSTSGTASVQYATSNGTGKTGTEYNATSGTLSFASGESSKTFTVTIVDDGSSDGNKTFNLTLSNATNVQFTSGLNTALVTINDDDSLSFGSGSFKFSRSTYAVSETSGTAQVTVQRTGGSVFAASVNFATTTGTAASGSDFTHTSGTLNFAVGEAAKLINIPIIKDTQADSGETFTVELSNPTGSVPLIDPYMTTVTIE